MNLLSLFDYSGTWSRPYREIGWGTLQWDIQRPDNLPFPVPSQFRDIHEFDDKPIDDLYEAFDESPDGMICAPPCTDFAGSGARWWEEKDKDGRTQKSIEMMQTVFELIDIFKPDFYAIENPVGRLKQIFPNFDDSLQINWSKPEYFNPCDYSGYLNLSAEDLQYLEYIDKKDGVNITFKDWEHIIKCNAYTKKTCLWGEFTMPEKKPIKPVKAGGTSIGTSAMNRLGSKSKKTKELRSNTPMGFAKAFCEYNQGGYNRWLAEQYDDYIEDQMLTNPVNYKDTRALSVIYNYS